MTNLIVLLTRISLALRELQVPPQLNGESLHNYELRCQLSLMKRDRMRRLLTHYEQRAAGIQRRRKFIEDLKTRMNNGLLVMKEEIATMERLDWSL